MKKTHNNVQKNYSDRENVLAVIGIAIAALTFVGSWLMPSTRLFLAAPAQPPPVDVKLPSEAVPGIAEKSWCVAMRNHWQFRRDEWGEDNQTIRALMEEYNCGYWGIVLP